MSREGKAIFLVLIMILFGGKLISASVLQQFYPSQILVIPWGPGEDQVSLRNGPDRRYGPRSFDVDENKGRLYVLDTEKMRIAIFELDGSYLWSVPVPGCGQDLICASDEMIYVLDTSGEKIVRLDLSGRVTSVFYSEKKDEAITGLRLKKDLPVLETVNTRYPGRQNPPDGKGNNIRQIGQASELVFELERLDKSVGQIKIQTADGQLKNSFRIKPLAGQLETITLAGQDRWSRLYIVTEESVEPGWKIKRMLRKYTLTGELLSVAEILYSNYAYHFKDLRVTGSGRVYQLLPAPDGLHLISWQATSNVLPDSSGFWPRNKLNIDLGNYGEINEMIAPISDETIAPVGYHGVRAVDVFYLADLYATALYDINQNNVTPSEGISCGGKTVITPVSEPGRVSGVLYKWRGFSGIYAGNFTDCGYYYSDGLKANRYAGDINQDGKTGSCCAVGVDAGGFISQCWQIGAYLPPQDLPTVCYTLQSIDYLRPGDALINMVFGEEALLFVNRNINGTFSVMEASTKDGKVSTWSYQAYELVNFRPLAYKKYQPSLNNGERVKVITVEKLLVQKDNGDLYEVAYPATGTVLSMRVMDEMEQVKVQWDNIDDPGWCNAAGLIRIPEVIVTTKPPALRVVVDGTEYSTPVSFYWEVGSFHSVEARPIQEGEEGERYVFHNWYSGLYDLIPGGTDPRQSFTVKYWATTIYASYSTEYSLTAEVNPSASGSVSPAGTSWHYSGEVISLTGTPAPGYNFLSWSGDINSYKNPVFITMDGPKRVTANFTDAEPVNVTLATAPPGLGLEVDGVSYIAPVTFQWIPGAEHDVEAISTDIENYYFRDWSDGAPQKRKIVVPETEVTYTANYDQKFYFNVERIPPEGGTVTPEPGLYLAGQKLTLLASPARHYAFTRWENDVTGENNPVELTMDGQKLVYAYFTPTEYVQVTFVTDPPGLKVAIDGQIYDTPITAQWVPESIHEIDAVTSQDASEPGRRYVFTAWSDGGSAIHQVIAPLENRVFTASYNQEYILTVTPEPWNGGNVTPYGFGWYQPDSVVTVTATPGSGYYFSGWSGDAEGQENPLVVVMDRPKIITAQFAKVPTVPITILTEPRGLWVSIDNQIYYGNYTIEAVPGTQLTISVPSPQIGSPGVRYVFSHWLEGGERTQTIIVPDHRWSYIAYFDTEYSLLTQVNPPGAGRIVPEGINWYKAGQQVSVEVIPEGDYVLASWGGDGSGSLNPLVIIMSTPKSVTANLVDGRAYPPANVTIQRLTNNLIFFKENINRLTWQTNSNNQLTIQKYLIFFRKKSDTTSDYKLLVELNGSARGFDHRGLKKDEYFTYRITAVNSNQRESTFVEVGN